MYDKIADNYHDIFPLNNDALEFSVNSIELGRVLDVGCGTGELSISLAKKGYTMTGIDLDEKMIEKAMIDKSEIENVDFKVLDMKAVSSIIYDDFNGVICFGNTFAHLTDSDEMKTFLKNIYKILKDNGKLLIQILNYSYIKKNNIIDLPLIKTDKFKFYRSYREVSENKLLYFDINLEMDGQSYKGTTILKPITDHELKVLLEEAGFKNIKFYGSFKKDLFDVNSSFILIAQASK